MRSTIDEYLKRIDELLAFLNTIEEQYKVQTELLRLRKKLDYAAFIVAIYKSFEQFIEDLLWSFTELESSRNKYSELHQKLQTSHLKQSALLLGLNTLGEGRFCGVSHAGIIENLYSCTSGKEEYRLNRHAIISHNLNLKSETVAGMFAGIGIEDVTEMVCRSEALTTWFATSRALDPATTKEIPKEILELRLKDLVERRNQAVHAGTDDVEAIDKLEMTERLTFFRAYGQALYNVLGCRYLSRYYISPGKCCEIGPFLETPKHDGFVVIIGPPTISVHRGQAVIGARQNEAFRWGQILEIRTNDVVVESFDPTQSTSKEIGLRLSFPIRRRNRLFALVEPDQCVGIDQPL